MTKRMIILLYSDMDMYIIAFYLRNHPIESPSSSKWMMINGWCHAKVPSTEPSEIVPQPNRDFIITSKDHILIHPSLSDDPSTEYSSVVIVHSSIVPWGSPLRLWRRLVPKCRPLIARKSHKSALDSPGRSYVDKLNTLFKELGQTNSKSWLYFITICL